MKKPRLFLIRLWREISGKGGWFGDTKIPYSKLTGQQQGEFVREVVKNGKWTQNEKSACSYFGVILDIDYANDRFITSLYMHGD